MGLNEYQRLANQTDQQPETGNLETDSKSILVPLLGMAGEVGELLGEHKKWLRDGTSYKLFPERVKEELGDLLWYLSNVATKHGLTLEDVADVKGGDKTYHCGGEKLYHFVPKTSTRVYAACSGK